MQDFIQEFIETHIDIIDKNDFETLYIELMDSPVHEVGGLLTEVLLDAGINPFEYLKTLPMYSLASARETKEFKVPSHLTEIEMHAFTDSTIEKLYIPKSIKNISCYACYSSVYLKEVIFEEGCTTELYGDLFVECTSLEIVEIPSSITYIDPTVFSDCNKFKVRCKKDSAAYKYATDNMYEIEVID